MEHIIAKLLQDFEQGKMNRRQLIKSLALASAAAPIAQADNKGLKAASVNHISYEVADYAKTRDFYAGLLGMQVVHDDGKQCSLVFFDSFSIPRHAREGRKPPFIDHVAYTIDNWDK